MSSEMPAYFIGEKDTRPWGTWEVINFGEENGEEFCEKKITVTPGGILSLQSHKLRREEWTVLEGILEVTCNDDVFTLSPGEKANIPQGAVHRMANRGNSNVVVREIQRGLCREDDIVRYEDVYGRK